MIGFVIGLVVGFAFGGGIMACFKLSGRCSECEECAESIRRKAHNDGYLEALAAERGCPQRVERAIDYADTT